MKIYTEFNEFYDLSKNCWSGAIQTPDTISEHDKEEELMYLLEECFCDGVELTELNDFLWFEDDYIFECLGIEQED